MENDAFTVGIKARPYNYVMREARKRKGLTQAEVGLLVGLPTQYIGDIELMKVRPSINEGGEIADALEVERTLLFPDWLDQPLLHQTIVDALDRAVTLDRQQVADAPDLAADVVFSELHSSLEAALDTLTQRQAKVIRLRFGWGGAEKQTLAQIARDVGFTQERVRQVESKALRKLRHPGLMRECGYSRTDVVS